MVLVPQISPRSFLFFFDKGGTGYSYSRRDYSVPNHVTERYTRDFGWTADELRGKAVHAYDAPLLDTKRLTDWHSYTLALNRLHGLQESAAVDSVTLPRATEPGIGPGRFPLLNVAALSTLPKAAKTKDIRRMLDSPQSEDWVTWNLLNLVLSSRPDMWWGQLYARAKEINPNLDLPGARAIPQLRFWQTVASPKAYEASSRERMRKSSNPIVAARSRDPKPVEGASEIDVIIESSSFLIYVEAKLDSDIRMHTTYDPGRNQIVRNIDCLLDSATGRAPFFWMFVRDASPARAYTQLMTKYREDPQTLSRDLPHRDPAHLQKVAQGLTLMTWRDIGKDACAAHEADNEQLLSIKRELWRRIQ